MVQKSSLKNQLVLKPSFRQGAIILTAAVALAISAGTLYSLSRSQPNEQSPSPTSSAKKTAVNAVAALGYLEPQGEVIHLSAPTLTERARVEKLFVKRGDRIKVGQVVAILDSYDRFQAALIQAGEQVKVARARLEQVEAGAKQGDIKAQEAKFQRTKAELTGQIITQKATVASLEAQLQGEKSAQQATIERIEAELQNARTECGRYQSLYRSGAVSASQRDSICLQEVTARERLDEGRATLNRIVTSRQEQINEATANLNRTVATEQKQIEEAQATLDAVAEVRPVDIRVARAEIATAEAAVQRARADLDLTYVRSPRDGQILKIHTWPGEIVGDRGIVEIGQTDQMYVTTEVYETDIGKVRIGQKATITSDGVTGDLKGTVDEIGLQIAKKDVLGTDPVADADARVVEVKIRLSPEESQKVAGLTNLQVNVVIHTSYRDSTQNP